jgi:alkanesulfonate monooxygenase SsuD/methylene tetrahydromethanopterin reductase-like flavin-dependent oxidoreductase (luciferase family)
VWSFGTGPRSAELAARHSTAFGYSLFHNMSVDDTASVEAYRNAFQPSAHRPEPLVAIAVAGLCAETEREARRLVQTHRNEFIVPTVIGSPRQCHEQLETIADRYKTRELVFMDVSSDLEPRLNSFRLLAEVLELAEPDASICDTVTFRDFQMACTD